MIDSFPMKYEYKPNETLETSTLVPHVNIKTFALIFGLNAKLTDLLMNTHFKKRPLIVMICVNIKIYDRTPVRSQFTKNN